VACNPCEVWRVSRASTTERTAATMDFVLDSCILPSSVNAGEPFTIQIKYKLCTIETRNPENMMVNFPDMYDGGWRWQWGLYPFAQHEFWIWRLVETGLLLGETSPAYYQTKLAPGEVNLQKYGRSQISPGDIFTYTFNGTIEQLMGREFPSATTVKLYWSIYGLIYGWYGNEYWPWGWPLEDNFLDFSRACWIEHQIQVNVLPDFPYPTFKTDLCTISKTTVAPDEQFSIKVVIENQNAASGNYKVGCYCEGSYTQLATGIIAGHGTKSHTFSVTANQLAHCTIAESQYLVFTIAVDNNEGETDRWTPAAIAVIVTELETANLSGKITDKTTGAGLVGVSVTTSAHSTTTSTGGYYQLEGLSPGKYDIEFTKAGYYDSTQSKTLYVGGNTLNVTMTPTTEPPPSETPWGLIGIGGAAILGLGLVLSQIKRGKKK